MTRPIARPARASNRRVAGMTPVSIRSGSSPTTAKCVTAARGRRPVVFVSHRPNVAVLTMELNDEGELLVARANGKGEVDVLGRLRIPDAP